MPPPPHPQTTKEAGGTYCFWDGSHWRQRQRRRKTSCPLRNLNTLWNILMILGRNVEQDQTTYRIQEWQLCLSSCTFCTFGVITLCFIWKRFRVRSVTWIPFGIFWGYLAECRTGPDDVSRTRMTTLPFLLLLLSSSVIFDNDNPLFSCPLCKSKTLWNIFMILGRNVEQDQTTCCV